MSILFSLGAWPYAVIGCKLKQNAHEGCDSCATVVQVLQDLFYVLLHVLFYLWSLLKAIVREYVLRLFHNEKPDITYFDWSDMSKNIENVIHYYIYNAILIA